MAVTVEQKMESPESSTGDNARAELRYVIRGTADRAVAATNLDGTAPATYNGLVQKGLNVNAVFVDINDATACIWEGIARYGLRRQEPDTGASEFGFETGGGTRNITQSRSTVGIYPSGAPSMGGAIRPSKNGVEGVDRHVPAYKFHETHYLDDSYVTGTYKENLVMLTGTVNQAQFKGLAAGEVLFMGGGGTYRAGQDDWEITFDFAARPNRTDISIGGITGIDKRGWEYLWVQYDTDKVGSGTWERVVQQPLAVYVEQVYRYGDFSQLGIGT